MPEGVHECFRVGEDHFFDDFSPNHPPEVDASVNEASVLLGVVARCYTGRPGPTLDESFLDDKTEVWQPTEQLVAQPFANRVGASYVGRQWMVTEEHEVDIVGQGRLVESLF